MCENNYHPNDLRIEKKEYAPGKQSYFVDGQRVNYRVTEVADIFWPFEKKYWADFIIDRTTKNARYLHIVKNSSLTRKEKREEIYKVWNKAAKDGTDTHLLPELYMLNEKKYKKLFATEMLKKMQKIVNKLDKKEQFNVFKFQKSFEQFLPFHKKMVSKGYIPFKPEWKIWLKIVKQNKDVVLFGGTIDDSRIKILPDGKSGVLYLGDWKHMKTIRKNSRIDTFPSFITSVKDKVYLKEFKYYIQLNIYRHIVEKNYLNKPFYFNGKKIKIKKVKCKIVCLHEELKEAKEFKPFDLRKDMDNLFDLFRCDKIEQCKKEYAYDGKIKFKKKYSGEKRKREWGLETSNKKAKGYKEPDYTFF